MSASYQNALTGAGSVARSVVRSFPPKKATIGSLGARTLQAPGLYWMQCFATKSWMFKERAKLSVRLDGYNLRWKWPNLSATGTTYNLNKPGAFGRFTGTVGDFSNFGSVQANVQSNIRVELES